MNSEKICLASKTIDISEHENYIELTNKLCYYDDKNLNNVMLPYKGVEEDAKRMASTLINMPLQAKYKKIRGLDDLGGHELSIDKAGGVVWGTASIGTHTNAWIGEPEEVITVSGEKKILPCLYATARVWKRNSNIISAIKRLFSSSGGLNSSWEISTNSYEYSNGVKKLTDYEFLGNTCLGSQVTPAYSGTSKTITMSSELLDSELMIAEALTLDLNSENDAFDINKNLEKEDDILDKDNITLSSEVTEEVKISEQNSETEIPTEEVSTSVEEKKTPEYETSETKKDNNETGQLEQNSVVTETEVSALTERDLRRRIEMACNEKIGDNSWCYITFWFPNDKIVWCEYGGRKSQLDFMKFTYEVDGDTVNVSTGEKVTLTVEPTKINEVIAELEADIATKADAIIKSGEEITKLNATISELTPFKDKFEKAEQERIEAELKEKKDTLISSITKSGHITKEEIESSEELKGFVDALDEKSLKAVLADRYIASLSENTTEVSETENETETASTNLDGLEDEQMNVKSIMKDYFGK